MQLDKLLKGEQRAWVIVDNATQEIRRNRVYFRKPSLNWPWLKYSSHRISIVEIGVTKAKNNIDTVTDLFAMIQNERNAGTPEHDIEKKVEAQLKKFK